ncbi:LOW QUALITY PROTEIN: cytosolic non-specific dipeptidase-like [Drosophila tropicalis]|uniref:LOW QUALITY PROTEIN: cytosolic non-specific dipeptidase-like n=1 Tax=Drosophila tropicalis TaxID=46794 RepID=UPI0035AB767A
MGDSSYTLPTFHTLLPRGHRKFSLNPNSPMNRILQIILMKRECYINDLWELMAFETVSTSLEKRKEIEGAIDWMLKRLVDLDVVAFGEHMGMQIMADSFHTVRMPRAIIGVFVPSPKKPTILIYGNLDVEDADAKEGWGTNPFVLTELGEFMYGRGVALDKGPLMCWMNALQSYKDAGLRLPVNLVFLIESMAHSNSLGLEAVLRQRISFFRQASCVVMATRRWQSDLRPCIVYGSRGLVYYHLEVQCAKKDLSSCEHGGTIYEALPDLMYLLSSLVNSQMQILVEGATDAYALDSNIVRCTDFDYIEYGQNLQVKSLPNNRQKNAALNNNWALTHLSIHGIEGANAEHDVRFIIPHKVIGKFSVSLAPNQRASDVTHALERHLGNAWTERGSPNKMQLCEKFIIPSWHGDCNTPEYQAAARAIQQTYNVTPNFIRDGGSMLAPSIFQEVLGKNVLVLPITENDNGGCPINERLTVMNYIKGTQLMANFLWEFAHPSQESEVTPECVPHV